MRPWEYVLKVKNTVPATYHFPPKVTERDSQYFEYFYCNTPFPPPMVQQCNLRAYVVHFTTKFRHAEYTMLAGCSAQFIQVFIALVATKNMVGEKISRALCILMSRAREGL